MPAAWNGAVLLDKPEGETSFRALSRLKKHYDTKKVGHTGTLDPMATGLLLALIGPATRCARFFSGLKKSYEADFTFGSETDTDDRTGTVTNRTPVPDLAKAIERLCDFVGAIEQVPPMYSAVHVNGKRAHALARAGELPQIKPRTVEIEQLEGSLLSNDTIRVQMRCSAGTYVRSLARDLGRAVGSSAHVSALRRTAIGPFRVEEVTGGDPTELSLTDALLRLGGFHEWPVDTKLARILGNGGALPEEARTGSDADLLIATLDDRAVAVGQWEPERFRYELVFPPDHSAEEHR